MTEADRRQRVEDICDAALQRGEGDRPAFVAAACDGDEGLRQEVEALLLHAHHAEKFLTASIGEVAADILTDHSGSLVGRHIGIYQILSLIGAGGMGEVYRARDTKLLRDVAIKVLPQVFTHDNDRLARLKREAQILAALNHPNIAAIFGLEKHEGVEALVLELVEGPSLADRIARGPVPLEEALPIAKQIVEALEAAHEREIIHRDLKPANVKVRSDGTVKVLDFGLAKLMDTGPNVTTSPPIASPAMMTSVGMLLGTAAYMSPEQARGKPADKRSDIWAFGVIVFEMLSGRPLFDGETTSDVLAKVIEREPEWAALPVSTPLTVHRLLRRCLEKDRKRRLADIADARFDIEESSEESASRDRNRWSPRLVSTFIAASAMSAMIAGGSTDLFLTSRPTSRPVTASVARLDLNLPPSVELYTGSARAVAVSPDNRRVAFVGVSGGVRQVFVRHLDQSEMTNLPLRGTETVSGVFFSPNGQMLGFTTANGRWLKTISLGDGLVAPLVQGVDFNAGGTWGADGRITFAKGGALWQIPAAGGTATAVTTLEQSKGEFAHIWPVAIGNGRRVLFTVVTGTDRDASRVEALTVASGERHVVVDRATFPLYASSGHLIFFRDDAMVATPFDVDRLAVSGPLIRVVEDLGVDNVGAPLSAVSDAGAFVYASRRAATSQLVWTSRVGLEEPIIDIPGRYSNPRLSPDGKQVLVSSNGDLYIQDTTRKTFTKLTSRATAGSGFAEWLRDGKRVVFRTQTGMTWMATDFSGRSAGIPETSPNDFPNSVGPDNSTLAFIRISEESSGDVYALSLDGDQHPRAILKTMAFEGGPQISPDGRWLIYASDEFGQSGQLQVYLCPFPSADRRWQVSTRGGTQPKWNRNGKEIFYRDGNKMMAVDLATSPNPTLSMPHMLFEQRYAYGGSITTPNYDVSPDGQRFLMVKDHSDSGQLNIVLNWSEELKQRVPTR